MDTDDTGIFAKPIRITECCAGMETGFDANFTN
jgi:hypothetical protein